MSEYHVIIKGEPADDDGLTITLPGDSWDYAQEGICPDCGATWFWFEAGHVPGTRKCIGRPIEPIGTLMDRRVPQPNDYDAYHVPSWVQEEVSELYRERNTANNSAVEDIDRKIIMRLGGYISPPVRYDDSGCGSYFSVQQDEKRWYIQRERMYS